MEGRGGRRLKVTYLLERLDTDLRKILFKEQSILDKQQKCRIILDVAEGLAALHKGGFVHCDVKLQNVLTEKGSKRVKLIDFGLVKRLEESRKVTQSLGFSERTSAREYLLDNEVSTAVDVWSLGILAYEVFSGRLAWQDFTGPQVVLKVSSYTPFFSANPPTGLPSLDALLEETLDYAPKKRPSLGEFRRVVGTMCC